MILLSHPTGNANVRAIAESLLRVNRLESFHTSIATYPGNVWDVLSKVKPLGDFGRRGFTPALAPFTQQYPVREVCRMAAGKLGLKALTAHESGRYSVDAVYRAHDEKTAAYLRRKNRGIEAVYAYEDGALATFHAARERGILCCYDLPIAYWATGRRLQEEEADRRPEWAPTLGGGIQDSAEKTARKQKELSLADVVVGPGSFVMNSLPASAAGKLLIASPFGSPPAGDSRADRRSVTVADQPLRVLFVGSMGQRKGLGDLFEAMGRLRGRRIELVVLGSLLAPLEFYRGQYADFVYEPTRAHGGVLELMRSCHIFCLPSIVEGRALVMQEAMSQGLPVIITENTGGADLVIPGKTGFLIPIRSPDSIAESISWFDDNRTALPAMSAAAVRHAANYTWSAYGDRVVTEISREIDRVNS